MIELFEIFGQTIYLSGPFLEIEPIGAPSVFEAILLAIEHYLGMLFM